MQGNKKNPFDPYEPPAVSDDEAERFYRLKRQGLEQILGKMHDLVGHAIIPFQIGGAVDMYYFPNALPGTGFVTMELIEPDGSGSQPSRIGTYELVAFTKYKIQDNLGAYKVMPFRQAEEEPSSEKAAFEKIERRMCRIFTEVGRYSFGAILNPYETIEVPWLKGEEMPCLILDEYIAPEGIFTIGKQKHGLLLIIEVFRREMEHAMKYGSRRVLEKLKAQGYYPYSDLDRPPVV